MKKAAFLICAAFTAVAALPGCNALYQMQGMRKVKAEYDPQGKKMIILPFRDEALDYFESPEGGIIADKAGGYMRKHKITPVVRDGFFRPGVRAAYERHKKNMPAALKEIAESAAADLVLVGQIDRFSPRNRLDVNLARGRMLMSARLYDMTGDDPIIVWFMTRRPINYPEGRAYQWGTDLPEDELKLRMLAKAGEAVGKAFHSHLEPIK